MLTRLGVKNFKSWRDIPGMRLAPITGLFGTNSSGKTSLLQILLLLKQTTESADRTQVLNLGGGPEAPYRRSSPGWSAPGWRIGPISRRPNSPAASSSEWR